MKNRQIASGCNYIGYAINKAANASHYPRARGHLRAKSSHLNTLQLKLLFMLQIKMRFIMFDIMDTLRKCAIKNAKMRAIAYSDSLKQFVQKTANIDSIELTQKV